MRRAALLGALALLAAGCGSGAQEEPAPKPPRLPHALAQSWAQQADSVASALAGGDDCTADARAAALQSQVIDAVNARRIPERLAEPLVSGVNELADRISCTPPPVTTEDEGNGKGHGHGHGKKEHKHGKGND